MFIFSNIPNNMDKNLYIKTIAKQYKIPFDTIWSLVKSCNSEDEFNTMITWYKNKMNVK